MEGSGRDNQFNMNFFTSSTHSALPVHQNDTGLKEDKSSLAVSKKDRGLDFYLQDSTASLLQDKPGTYPEELVIVGGRIDQENHRRRFVQTYCKGQYHLCSVAMPGNFAFEPSFDFHEAKTFPDILETGIVLYPTDKTLSFGMFRYGSGILGAARASYAGMRIGQTIARSRTNGGKHCNDVDDLSMFSQLESIDRDRFSGFVGALDFSKRQIRFQQSGRGVSCILLKRTNERYQLLQPYNDSFTLDADDVLLICDARLKNDLLDDLGEIATNALNSQQNPSCRLALFANLLHKHYLHEVQYRLPQNIQDHYKFRLEDALNSGKKSQRHSIPPYFPLNNESCAFFFIGA